MTMIQSQVKEVCLSTKKWFSLIFLRYYDYDYDYFAFFINSIVNT